MQFYTHEQYKKEAFAKDPELKELYEKEHLKFMISQEIKNIRNKRRYSQLELAKRIWTTQSVIARIESWNTNISMKTLQRVLIWLWAKLKIEI